MKLNKYCHIDVEVNKIFNEVKENFGKYTKYDF